MMIRFGELGIEFKSGVLFSISAFILSIIAGFAGRVPVSMILIRGLIIAPVFFVVGFGIILVVKNFVPEIYEILSHLKTASEDSAEKIEISLDANENVSIEPLVRPDSGFSEFTERDYERLQTVRDSDKLQAVSNSERMQSAGENGFDGLLNTTGGKLGKHIIVDNQLDSYEPKLMAQAIRTMMSKDKD